MTKIADLEGDVKAFKAATNDRLEKLEIAVNALTTKNRQVAAEARQTATELRQAAATADQRHAEILALIRTLKPPATTSPPDTTRAAPPSSPVASKPSPPLVATTIILPPTSRSPPLSKPPPFLATVHPTPSFLRPTTTTPLAHSLVIASKLLFKEFGFPIATTNRPPPLSGPFDTPLFEKGPSGYRIWNPGGKHAQED